MPAPRPFRQVDVFTAEPLLGNPVAVVHGADDLTDAQMRAFARWTDLSETVFLCRPTDPRADYRVRIFTPATELPFAGHPTLGSCHAWLEAGGRPQRPDEVVQECGVGLVRLRRDGGRLAFAAPALRDEPLPADVLGAVTRALGVEPGAVVDHRLLDNGPLWTVVLLGSADQVRALEPDFTGLGADLSVGVVGPYPDGGPAAFEVRGFALEMGIPEDPVTGSLNASVAQWLMRTGRAPERYVASQGAALGRAGRVHVERAGDATWVGGDCVTVLAGTVGLAPVG